MLKRFGVPTLVLIAALAMVVPAQAGVHFGIAIGGPVYTYPAPAPYAYPYSNAYPYPGYYAPYYYSNPYPYGYRFGFGNDRGRDGHGYDRRDFRDNHDRGYRNGDREQGGHRR